APVFPIPVHPTGLLPPSPLQTPPPAASTGKLFPMEPPLAGEISLAQAAAAVVHHGSWRHFGDAEPRTSLPGTTLPATTLTRATLFATKPGMVYAATQYRRNGDTLALVLTSGALMTLDVRDLDWIIPTHPT